jgi:hypothetical protein
MIASSPAASLASARCAGPLSWLQSSVLFAARKNHHHHHHHPPRHHLAVRNYSEAPTPLKRRRGGAQVETVCTGAGGYNGIAKMQNRRGISVSSYYDRSHYLHPHPYMRGGGEGGVRQRLIIISPNGKSPLPSS